MMINSATITVTDLDTATEFYSGILGLSVQQRDSEVTVQLGRSTLILQAGTLFEGAHHLAFGIAPEDFDRTLEFARDNLDPIDVNGTEVVVGPDNWNSKSIYFRGPDGIVLEYIAREAHRGRLGPQQDGPPRVTCLSEVGIAVVDVPATVKMLAQTFDLPPFPPQSDVFAPVGDHDGLLILVESTRVWFPTSDATPPRGPLVVSMTTDAHRADLTLNPMVTIRSS